MSDGKPAKKKPRGRPIPLPSWFLLELQEATKDLDKPGKSLSDQRVTDKVNAIGADERGEPWDRNTIRQFRRGVHPTLELAEAMCRVFGLQMPVFVARTREEANALAAIQRLRAPVPEAPASRPPTPPPIEPAAVLPASTGATREAPMSMNEVDALNALVKEREAKRQQDAYHRRLKAAIKRKQRG